MVYEMIAPNVYKVLVTQEDLSEYGLTYQSLDYSNNVSKEFLSNLIDEVMKISGDSFDTNKAKAYVESFPDTQGGCVLFVSLSQMTKPSVTPKSNNKAEKNNIKRYCYTFNDISTMVKAVTVIMPYLRETKVNEVVVQSQLYKVQKYYSLVISYYTDWIKITSTDIILKEYICNDVKMDSEVGYAYLHFLQQGECLMEKDALEKIIKYL